MTKASRAALIIAKKIVRKPFADGGNASPDDNDPSASLQGPVIGSVQNPERVTNPVGMYSAGAEAAAALPQAKGTPQQFKAMLQKAGVKPSEFENSNFDEAFANQPSVTRDQVVQHFQNALPKVDETVLSGKSQQKIQDLAEEAAQDPELFDRLTKNGRMSFDDFNNVYDRADHLMENHVEDMTDHLGTGEDDPAKFSDYQLPGGENYRELLLKAPGSDFKSSHWGDPNVLAHLRMNDRFDEDGNKALHIEELQSDWGQEGRKNGFRTISEPDAKKVYAQASDKVWELIQKRDESPEGLAQLQAAKDARDLSKSNWDKALDDKSKTPSAPYVTNTKDWTDLALKRALQEAAKGGYDKLTWTPGEQQAARYDLSKRVDQISYHQETKRLTASDKMGNQAINRTGIDPEKLSDYIGKEAAKKLLEQPINKIGQHILQGADLKIGGEGMKSYYDQIVPSRLKELTKKLDPNAKIEQSAIQVPADDNDAEAGKTVSAPGIRITPQMREKILKGLPAFKAGGAIVEKALRLTSKARR